GQVEVGAPDARVPQLTEELLEVGPALLDLGNECRDAVAVDLEGATGLEGRAAGVLQTAQGDDVAPALPQVARGTDDERPCLVAGRGRVELREVRVVLGTDEDTCD